MLSVCETKTAFRVDENRIKRTEKGSNMVYLFVVWGELMV